MAKRTKTQSAHITGKLHDWAEKNGYSLEEIEAVRALIETPQKVTELTPDQQRIAAQLRKLGLARTTTTPNKLKQTRKGKR